MRKEEETAERIESCVAPPILPHASLFGVSRDSIESKQRNLRSLNVGFTPLPPSRGLGLCGFLSLSPRLLWNRWLHPRVEANRLRCQSVAVSVAHGMFALAAVVHVEDELYLRLEQRQVFVVSLLVHALHGP